MTQTDYKNSESRAKSVILDAVSMAQLLLFFSRAMLFLGLLHGGLLWLSDFYQVGSWITAVAITVIPLVALVFLRCGRVREAAVILLWGSCALILGHAMLAGLRGAPLTGIPLLIVVSGWLLGMRHTVALVVTALSVLFGLALSLQFGGMHTAPPVPPLNSWGVFAVILVITTYLTYLSHRLYIQRFSEKERLAAELNLITEKVPVMLASVDSKGVYSFVNRRYADFFNKTPQDIIGKPVAEILDAASFAQLQEALSLHQRQFRSRRPGPDGDEVHWIEADIMPDYHDDGTMAGYYAILRDITDEVRSKERLDHLAHHDALTSLPNRVLLSERMNQALTRAERYWEKVAVCYLDLDSFKPVNDTWGHAMGDKVLIETARRLEACLRSGDTVARLGGDEFVILLGGVNEEEELRLAVSRILMAISSPISLGEQDVEVSGSIGVAIYPRDGDDPDTLLRHADQAMFAAKQEGKNRFTLFDSELERRTRTQHTQLTRIEQALNEGEFRLFYQPKVDMRQGVVVGAEALIRWQHPQEGLLAPGLFLPFVENTELSVRLGNWVIREALGQMTAWADSGFEMPVSVNISGYHLQQPNFATVLLGMLDEFPRVKPEWLEIEILETAAMDDVEQVSQIMHECASRGVSFSLDDFGTGYSSLTYFRRLPSSVLKIDGSFVRDMLDDREDLAIVEGVIALASSFGRRVIAEGVESTDHGVPLLYFGCDWAQGYGIARPMPASVFPDWVRLWQAPSAWEVVGLFNWQKKDFPLLLAEIDLQRWVQQLVNVIESGHPGSSLQLSSRSSRLGQWLIGTGHQYYGSLESFKATQESHDALYEVARKIVEQLARDPEGAQEQLPYLIALKDDLHQIIQALKFEVGFRAPAEGEELAFTQAATNSLR